MAVQAFNKFCKKRGVSLVEMVIGLGIISFISLSFIRVFNYQLRSSLLHSYDIRASLLAEEGIEAVKFLRDSSWSQNIATLSTDLSYPLNFDEDLSSWSTTTDNFIDGIFERTIIVNDVFRNDNDEISEIGTLDPGTKKVTVNVSFASSFGTTTRSIPTYIMDIFDN